MEAVGLRVVLLPFSLGLEGRCGPSGRRGGTILGHGAARVLPGMALLAFLAGGGEDPVPLGERRLGLAVGLAYVSVPAGSHRLDPPPGLFSDPSRRDVATGGALLPALGPTPLLDAKGATPPRRRGADGRGVVEGHGSPRA